MAPKKEKGPKQIKAASELTAFLNMYKAACKRYAVLVDKALTEEVEAKLLDMKALEKVSLRGPQHTSGSICAVLDAMAGYAAVKNFACWGCNLGDEGLYALSQLLRGASTGRTWVGSKPRLVEVVHDGAQVPADRWPERYLAHANGLGGMVTRGPGFQLPSLALGQTQAVTLDTVLLQPEAAAGTAALDLSSLERQLTNLMASTSTAVTSVLYDNMQTARHNHDAGADAQIPRHPVDGRPMLYSQSQMAFSPEALKEFALALGAQGHMIQALVLDHNHLGDIGAKILAAGLKRCAPLKQLSLAHCGIGPGGGAALGASLVPDPNKLLADVQPKYTILNLSNNPLCAAGVTALATGLQHVTSLKVLQLAAVELHSEHKDLDALQALADCLNINQSISQVDLDANAIGDVGATVLLPFLQQQQHIRKFRITPRLSRPVMQAVNEAIRANLPKKVVKKKVAKKK
ncbi:hypothetical protein HYH02_000783 [Chlamydomonas schloesseri]|uniref:Flagellar associated protein n=1 Tax=Chlamydomonas schloesseri TaxID=2026947 RepID=A0A836BD14_9CHLO|nr:hypothetical protein HYH02_000783 [Chlamydomonas schloesseri]|eukprot:KAG2454956.1 hypothetical protein HYH02_000783 [Chlamydomonas schloesseri]